MPPQLTGMQESTTLQTSTEQQALIKQLNVIDAQTQRFLRNIGAHSVILDLLCEDEDGARINVEMQKTDDDDHIKRVRFNSSNIDTTFTVKGLDYKDFPDIYVIFISKFDMFQESKTIYHLETIIKETGTSVNDGIHRIFVNCAINDGSDIAELMQYFKNSTGKNNKFPKLSDRVYYFKESKEGADAMTQIVEEYANKKVFERDKETAKSFLQNGASVELVKKSIPTLSAEFIEKLSRQLTSVEQ